MVSVNESMRVYYLFLYMDARLLDPGLFEFHHSIGCHLLRDRSRVIFFNRSNGAVSETVPVLNGIEQCIGLFDQL